tara:strand:+ start:735 stop:1913 length:1179 start_codon:yes stop_codon:yes gene_type:complete
MNNNLFNIKTKIRKNTQHKLTLDVMHKNKIDTLETEKNDLPNLKNELETLQNQKKELSTKHKSTMTDAELDLFLSIDDKIIKLQKEIDNLKNDNHKINYLLDTSDIIFEYYDSDNTNNTDINNDNNDISIHNKNIKKSKVSDFFNIKNFTNNKKAVLFDKYLELINNKKTPSSILNKDICIKCNNTLLINITEGIAICNACGEQIHIILDSEKPSYKDQSSEYSYFCYRRINHYNEWLAQFQAKETTDISPEIINKILDELKKDRITNLNTIKYTKIREILKKLKLNKFYEHVPHIINKLNGIPPPIIPIEIEDKLRTMFKEIQTPFLNNCPKKRKNFLSYSYVLHKFMQLLGLTEHLKSFPLLKSREKLYDQDQIWELICKELNWPFYRSI